MSRYPVLGVRSAAAAEPRRHATAPTGAPGLDFDLVQAIGGLAALLLGGVSWWRHGALGPHLVLLVPFWFCVTPLVALGAGHGVVVWSKLEHGFVPFAADAGSWRARLLLGADAALGIAITWLLVTMAPPIGC